MYHICALYIVMHIHIGTANIKKEERLGDAVCGMLLGEYVYSHAATTISNSISLAPSHATSNLRNIAELLCQSNIPTCNHLAPKHLLVAHGWHEAWALGSH